MEHMWQQLSKPYGFTTSETSCNIFRFYSVERNIVLLPTYLWDHNWPQTETSSWSALSIWDTSFLIRICIMIQSKVMISGIIDTIVYHTFQVPHHMIYNYQVNMFGINHILNQIVHNKAYIRLNIRHIHQWTKLWYGCIVSHPLILTMHQPTTSSVYPWVLTWIYIPTCQMKEDGYEIVRYVCRKY